MAGDHYNSLKETAETISREIGKQFKCFVHVTEVK